MKKMTFRKLFGGLCCAAMVAFAASCAQGADDESWSAGVTNSELEAPTIDDSCFDVISTSDGEKVQFTWPVVYGAGGYHVTVYEESDPETVIIDEDVDGQTVTFPMVEDTNFNITITTLGNKRYNNETTGIDYTITWRPHYYFLGFRKPESLEKFEQTIGWDKTDGSWGTFDPLATNTAQ